jgi:hypothetical protein
MANLIKIKRSAVPGKIPLTTDLELGELAINTHDGRLYLKLYDGTSEAVVAVGDGYTGSQGSIGYTGSKGDIGYTGSQGLPGEAAAIGYTGSIGFTGSQGDIG